MLQKGFFVGCWRPAIEYAASPVLSTQLDRWAQVIASSYTHLEEYRKPMERENSICFLRDGG